MTTREFLNKHGRICRYCAGKNGPAVQRDHFIKKSQVRRSVAAARERDNERYQVPVCRADNEAIGARLRVPVADAHLIPELERITGGVYATYNGTAADLRTVVR